MCLIERLEADRQYAEEAVHKEKRRKRLLESEVDSISLWKKQEHSLVVQKGRRQLWSDGIVVPLNESELYFFDDCVLFQSAMLASETSKS